MVTGSAPPHLLVPAFCINSRRAGTILSRECRVDELRTARRTIYHGRTFEELEPAAAEYSSLALGARNAATQSIFSIRLFAVILARLDAILTRPWCGEEAILFAVKFAVNNTKRCTSPNKKSHWNMELTTEP